MAARYVRRVSDAPRYTDLGAFKVLLALLIIAIAGVLALVVDLSKHEADAQQAQNLADSMSLAAAQALDGTRKGWNDAKLAALVTLKRNQKIVGFVGDHRDLDPDNGRIKWERLTLNAGHRDPYYLDAAYRGNKGRLGNITVEIERGVYWENRKNGSLKFEFQPLESPQDRAEIVSFGADPYVIANAVRMKLSIGGVKTAFGSSVGMSELPTVERSATSLIGNDVEECVFPIAVPLCQVMRNTQLSSGPNARTETYNAGMQCGREIIAAEANLETEERLEGLTRYLSYPLPEMVPMDGTNNECVAAGGYPAGMYPNCKASTMFATMGFPETSSPASTFGQASTPREINEMITAGVQCVRARLGTRFRSMNHAVDTAGNPFVDNSTVGPSSDGFLQIQPNSDLENQLAFRINASSTTFEQAFGGPDFGSRKSNYPTNRRLYRNRGLNDFSELRLTWPTSDGNDFGMGIMLTRPKGGIEDEKTGQIIAPDNDWINPACHSNQVTGDNVLPVKIMVIAPGEDNVHYCNHTSYLTALPDAQIPSSDTDPRVVGFLDAYVYDFHLNHINPGEPVMTTTEAVETEMGRPGGTLNDLDRSTLLDNNAWQITGTDSQSGAVLDSWYKEANKYHDDRVEWQACTSSCGDGPGQRNCGACREPSPPEDPDFTAIQPSLRDLVAIGKDESKCFQSAAYCFDTEGDDPDDKKDCITELVHPGKRGRDADKERLDILDEAATGVANKDKNCLPVKKHGQPADRAGSWEVKDLAPQYLCGGIRLRLSCDQSDIISIGRGANDPRRPIIVDHTGKK